MTHPRPRVVSIVAGIVLSLVSTRASSAEPVPDSTAVRSSSPDAEALRDAARAEVASEGETDLDADEGSFTAGALGLQSLNPEISVTGDFLAIYRSEDGVDDRLDNSLRNLGIHVESYLDPFSKLKAAVPVSAQGAELGEAYFTRFGLLSRFNLTLGKFRQQFGVVNRWHKHGLDQVDFPLPLRRIFGAGGLNQTGLSLEWQLPPLGGAAHEITLQLTNADNPRLFGGNTRGFPGLLAHYKNYRDLSKDLYLEIHGSGVAGRNDTWNLSPGSSPPTREKRLWTTVLGGGWTVLWEPTERMRYQNRVWRTELYWMNREILRPDGSGPTELRPWGVYSYLQARTSRTLEVGLRGDYFEPEVVADSGPSVSSLLPLASAEPDAREWLVAAWLTWHQSPWVRWRIEWDHLASRGVEADADAVHLQCVFAAGPHKHERY